MGAATVRLRAAHEGHGSGIHELSERGRPIAGVSALMTIISIASGASGRLVRVVIAEFVIWAIVTKRELFAERSGRRC